MIQIPMEEVHRDSSKQVGHERGPPDIYNPVNYKTVINKFE